MPRSVTTKVYQFDELSGRAKEKARDWCRQFVFTESRDWQFVYEDAATCADILGIDLRQRPVNGKARYEPAIYFSGFSSQGDGACFEGSWAFKPGAEKAIREHAPSDGGQSDKLHAIADSLAALPCGEGWSASIKHRGHYYHSGCMDIEVSFDDGAREMKDADGNAIDELPQAEFTAGEETVIQAMRDFADWIYRQLEAEYEYQSSDDTMDDNIRANEYEFTEDGDRA